MCIRDRKRNVLIRMKMYSGKDISAIKTDSPYIQEYINRIKKY